MTPHTIYFVRHGETVWNAIRRLQGRIDSPLTELGRAQALANAETLREGVPNVRDLPFIVSPLGRARATAQIILMHLQLPEHGYSVDERLIEMDFGQWEGLSFDEVQTNHADAWNAREAAKWIYQPPGGESYQEVYERLLDWTNGLTGDAVVVAHGVVGRILRGVNLSQPHDRIPSSLAPEHDRVYRLARGTEAAL
jgi:broad specificity phosphatase PhoE